MTVDELKTADNRMEQSQASSYSSPFSDFVDPAQSTIPLALRRILVSAAS